MIRWFRERKLNPKRILKRALGDFSLPSFPAVVADAMRRLRDPNSNIGEIADGLMQDPNISVQVLRVANSAVYSLRHPVRNVHHAVSLLGRGEVERLLLSSAVREVLPQSKDFDHHRFWQTAARRATTARALAQRLHPATTSEAYTASLLQHMAVPFLVTAQQDRYVGVLEQWQADRVALDVLERDALGCDHAVIAAAMSDEWGFPEALTAAIGGHHGGEDVPPAVALVAHLREVDAADNDFPALVAAIQELGWSEGDAKELVTESFEVADVVTQAMV
ncbi:MAG: HDOD domain-containing protein [Myxococcota bacterium]